MREKHHAEAEYDVQRRARAGTSAILRALVAGYLVYLAWQILQNVRTGETSMTPAVAYTAAGFFLMAAAAFAVYLIRRWRIEVEAARLPETKETDDTAEDDK